MVEGGEWANRDDSWATWCNMAETPAVPALCVSITGVWSFNCSRLGEESD